MSLPTLMLLGRRTLFKMDTSNVSDWLANRLGWRLVFETEEFRLEVDVELHITNLNQIDGNGIDVRIEDEASYKLREAMYVVHARYGHLDGIPFFLSEDGSYDLDVAGFFRYLLTDGVRSKNTLKTYGYHLSLWFRWLNEQGKSWKEATRDDLRLYYRVRHSQHSVSPSYWNVSSASIGRLYKFASDENIIAENPFPRKFKRVNSGGEYSWMATVNGLKDKGAANLTKFISIEEFLKFKRGFAESESKRERRMSVRNGALADVLIKSGMRISEALLMRMDELPNADDPKWADWGSCRVKLRSETTKGMKSRSIMIPKSCIREMQHWIKRERAIIVFHAKRRSTEYREPREIWLTEDGEPLTRQTVDRQFMRVSRITGVKCTPHNLRHSYAVYMLSRMIKIFHAQSKSAHAGERSLYQDIIEDPLRKLQRLLGHSQITSTYKYLDVLQMEDPTLHRAIDEWNNDLKEPYDLTDAIGVIK